MQHMLHATHLNEIFPTLNGKNTQHFISKNTEIELFIEILKWSRILNHFIVRILRIFC